MLIRFTNATILFSFLCLNAYSLFAQVNGQLFKNKVVTLSEDNQPLSVIIEHIRAQTGLVFSMNKNNPNARGRYTIHVKNKRVDSVLWKLQEKKGFTWNVDDKIIIIKEVSRRILSSDTILPTTTENRKLVLKGIVKDSHGNIIIGATVKLKDSKDGCITNTSGAFTLKTAVKDPILVISFIGYKSVEVPVSPDSTFHIQLPDSGSSLDEQIVIGYGTSSKRFNTSSISEVKAGEIGRYPVTNPIIALQGRVPGLLVTQSNGINGSTVHVQLTGQSSLFNGYDPLFIINGVPLAANNQEVNIFNSIASQNVNSGISPLTSINPADIESIEVLKDADATAIYGSRGANGVILITTKKDTAGMPRFSVDFTQGVSTISRIHLLSTPQYLEMRHEAFQNDGITPTKTPGTEGYAPDLESWDTTRQTDWQNLLIGGQAKYSNANISLAQGDKLTQLFLGIGFVRKTTEFRNNMSYMRGSLNLSINHTSADSLFQVGLYGNYSLDNNHLFDGSFNSIFLPPNAPKVYKYNAGNQLNWEEGGEPFENPLANYLKKYSIGKENLIVNLNIGYHILRNLVIKSSMGYNSMHVKEYSVLPIASQNPFLSDTLKGSSSFGNNDFRSFIIEPQAEYSFQLAGSKFILMAGGSWQYTDILTSAIVGGGYNNDAWLNSLEAAHYLIMKKKDRNEYKYAALFGRITYNLNNRYLLNISGRRDGSSRFSPGNRFNTMGAIGAAWIFSEEAFVKNALPFIHYGKLRGSFGLTGNDQIGDYKYLDSWSSTIVNPYSHTPAMAPDALYNKAYHSERSIKFLSGLDFQLLQNRIQGAFSFYLNRNDNQLVNLTLPSQTGFNSILTNYNAVIENKGWEIELSSDLLHKNAVTLNVGITLTIPKNKLLRYDQLSVSSYNGTFVVGQSVNVLNKLVSDGVDRKTGLYKLRDINNDGIYSSADYSVIGHLDPQYLSGIHCSLKFKGLSIEVLGELRRQMLPNYRSAIYVNNLLPGMMSNQSVRVLNRWQKPGDNADFARFSINPSGDVFAEKSYVLTSSVVYSRTTFFKLRNTEVSYCLPKSWASSMHIDNLRIYCQAQNLFTITNYDGGDPETANPFSLPVERTIAFGIQLSR